MALSCPNMDRFLSSLLSHSLGLCMQHVVTSGQGMGGFKGCFYLLDALYYTMVGFGVPYYVWARSVIVEKRLIKTH